jgi:hypothetical protein
MQQQLLHVFLPADHAQGTSQSVALTAYLTYDMCIMLNSDAAGDTVISLGELSTYAVLMPC